jgi:nucleoside-diphosphate-sugar epimerase
MINPATDRVLITGAAGAIGTALRNGLLGEWRHLRLTDIRPIADPTPKRNASSLTSPTALRSNV